MSPLLSDNFQAVFMDQLREFKEKRFLCDVRLVASEMEYHAHKLVLAACSPYFKELFQMKKNEELPEVTSVYLKNCQPDCVAVVLCYVYGGGLNLGQCEAADVLNVARACKISTLESLLVNFLDGNDSRPADPLTPQATIDSSKKRKRQTPTSKPQTSTSKPQLNHNQSHWSLNGGGSASKRLRGLDLKTEDPGDESWCTAHNCWQAACRCRSPPAGTMATPHDFMQFLLANAAAVFNPASNGFFNFAAAAALANGNGNGAPPQSAAACLPQAFASICQSTAFASGGSTPTAQLGVKPEQEEIDRWSVNDDKPLPAPFDDLMDDKVMPTDVESALDDEPPTNDNEEGCGGEAPRAGLTGSPKSHKKCDDPTASFDQILTDDRDGWCRNKKFIKKTANDGYQCTLCKKTYGRYNSVSYHVTIYHRNPPIICDHAGCSFRTREARYIHFHKFYRHDIPLPSNIDLETRRCPHCKHVAKSPAMLDKHMKRHDVGGAGGGQGTPRATTGTASAVRANGAAPPTLKATRPRHRCAACSAEFGSKAVLVQHVASCGASVGVNAPAGQREADAQVCDQCPYRTFNAGTLSQHKMFKHSADLWLNKFQCNQCNYSSPSQAKVFVHKNQKHGVLAIEGVVDPIKTDSPTDEDEESCKLSIVTDETDHCGDDVNKKSDCADELKIDEDLNKFANFLVTTADSLPSLV